MLYDMLKFAEKLEKRRLEPTLVKYLKAMSRIAGLQHDLENASNKLDTIYSIAAQVSKDKNSILATYYTELMSSLYDSVLITYVRSTASEGKPAPLDVRGIFSEDQRTKHKHLYDLRNKAIAHRGAGKHPVGSHMYDGVVLDFMAGLGVTGRRTSWSQEVIENLRELVPIARRKADSDYEAIFAKASKELHDSFVRNPKTVEWVREFPYNPSADTGSNIHLNLFGQAKWSEPAKRPTL